ncbi:DNA polymerase III subunit beta [Caldilinea sp.]|uniref:DNA polymerase III subunit beta n=1 Tax=Caldilinea sp. TaxID=2293560 RepID=UPI002CD4DCDB|nr:DNA polymerase III subunit beta [Caldilinea sp.]
MRVSCLQENLAKGLAIVGRAVSSRSTMPVLANILIEASDNQLRLAATNLEIGVTCWIGAKVEDPGSITVPARLLTEFVNSLPPERIDMELTVRTLTLKLRCASFDANMKGIDAASFPIIPTIDGVTGGGENNGATTLHIELPSTGLRKMVDQVVFAASTDESRPTLTGVEVTFKEGRVTMAATDGYRLSVRSAEVDGSLPDAPTTVIVPARSLGELARVSADADEARAVQVLVTQERNQILFQIWGRSGETKGGAFHRVEMASQLIDANFPDYRAIIPKTHTTRTVVDTAALLKAVRVAFLFARDNANIVRLKIQPANGDVAGYVSLAATSTEIGDSVNELEAMIEGDDLEISFNAKYLIDVLSQIDEPQVVIETTQPTRPGTIRPVGMGDKEFLHVVMPMHPTR